MFPALLIFACSLQNVQTAATQDTLPRPKSSQDSIPIAKTIPVVDSAATEITFMAVGDVMLGSGLPDERGKVILPPHDGAHLLDDVAPILTRGDVVFGNLEGPMLDKGTTNKCNGKPPGTCYAFRVPTRYARHLKKAGFTVMGLANNHIMDFGPRGPRSSRLVLDSLGIAHTGEIGDIARLTVKGKKVAVIAFATYGSTYNLLDHEDAMETIREARTESDLVIVAFHGGAEGAAYQHVPKGTEKFLGENRGDLRKFTHGAIDAGADIVVGSGPHVVRGMEVYNGKLIAYSLGNFATYGTINVTGVNGLSLILEARLGMDGTFLGGTIHAVRQRPPGGPELDTDRTVVRVLQRLSTADFGENSVPIGDDGELLPIPAIAPPAIPPPSVPDSSHALPVIAAPGIPDSTHQLPAATLPALPDSSRAIPAQKTGLNP